MNAFSFHPEAEADLNEIWDFIAEDSADAADRVRDSMHGRRNPRGPTRPDRGTRAISIQW